MGEKRLSLAGKKALEAMNRVLRENGLPEVSKFEEIPGRVQDLLARWSGNSPTRIEKKVKGEEKVLVLSEDHLKTRIVRVEEILAPQGTELEESEFTDELTDIVEK
jgi:hypothetical protein